MVMLPPRHCHLKNPTGMTLIEVLIALAIVSIALTAVLKATAQHIRAASYLQSKTIALWVGQQVMNESRLHLLPLPTAPDSLKQNTTALDKVWYWQVLQETTSNKHIKKITVKVAAEEEASPMVTLEGYLYDEK